MDDLVGILRTLREKGLISPGLATGEGRNKELERLNVPRWPALPMDMVLVLELAIYNFRHEAWRKLRRINPWRDIVKRSERLIDSVAGAHRR